MSVARAIVAVKTFADCKTRDTAETYRALMRVEEHAKLQAKSWRTQSVPYAEAEARRWDGTALAARLAFKELRALTKKRKKR